MTDAPSSDEAGPAGDTVPTHPPSIRANRFLVFLPVAIFAALATLFAVRLLSPGDPSRIPSALIGRAAPSVALPPLAGLTRDGAAVPGWSGADLARRGGPVSVVNVWASWCAPCREEQPALLDLAKGVSGIRLLGLNYKDKPDEARRFLGAFGNPFTAVGVDPKGAAAIDWGVYGAPETFIVGPDGTIRFKQVGPLTAETVPAFLDEIRKAATR